MAFCDILNHIICLCSANTHNRHDFTVKVGRCEEKIFCDKNTRYDFIFAMISTDVHSHGHLTLLKFIGRVIITF